ncbi:MAG: ATP-binding protein [Anaeroplasma sp.]
MKRKYILMNTMIIVSSLFLFLIASIYIVDKVNSKNAERQIKDFLHIIENEYDGTNMVECSLNIHNANNDIRITFISSEGIVLYDTDIATEENHLQRPEIQNLGEISYRYSKSLDKKMLYIACYIQDVYIRIALPEASITSIVNSLWLYGGIVLVTISLLSILFVIKTSNEFVKPIKSEINKLGKIVGDIPSYDGNDIELLSLQIDGVHQLINDKINSINYEKDKLNFIIQNIHQGLIIINPDGVINLINEKALSILERTSNNYNNKSYELLITDSKLQSEINKAMKEIINSNIEQQIDKGIYNFNIASLDGLKIKDNTNNSVAVFIIDITNVKKTEKMKLDFFANASHELKSPLTSIIGYQQMIKEEIITDEEEIKDATNKTIKEANRMNQIIIEMLKLSELETAIEKPKEIINIKNITLEIINELDSQIKAKNILVMTETEDFDILIPHDDIYHLLRNVIDNAIKYNVNNGKIFIMINSNAKIFKIKDTGIGIKQENIDRIFERFYRVDKAKSKELGGTGLGLAIVKHICINNNVEIKVKSDIGKGSTFEFYFK